MSHQEPIKWLKGVRQSSVAIVVAHQDDESLAFCEVLRQCPGALVVHVTDGAPQDPNEWKGRKSREAYAHVRQREVNAALDVGGHTGVRVCLNVVDTDAMLCMVNITMRLTEIFSTHQTSLVFTHAYEGGHPDHDATAFAVHNARPSTAAMCIVEAPFYHTTSNGLSIWQKFRPHPDVEELVIKLNRNGREQKSQMLDAHASQAGACSHISFDVERLREAPRYDFKVSFPMLSRNHSRALIGPSRWTWFVEEALLALA